MILGMSVATFTTVHVILSLIGIATGLIVLFLMVRSKHSTLGTGIFLATTILTSITGFPIPPLGFDPPRAVGILSLLLLAVAVAALYIFGLAGRWRWIYAATATTALYFNCFVGVVQSFQKIPVLAALAPTQTEPPFAMAQIAVLAIFIALGILAARRFRLN
jgi:hypothetical protein